MHEALVVEFEAIDEPVRVRLRADHDEDVADVAGLGFAAIPAGPTDPSQHVIAVERGYFRAPMQGYVRRGFDAANQIVGHRLGEPLSANQHVDMPDMSRQEYGRLSGRIATADDGHVLAATELRFHRRCGVVDPLPLEPVVILNVELAVACAGGNDDRTGGDPAAVLELEPKGRLRTVHLDDGA